MTDTQDDLAAIVADLKVRRARREMLPGALRGAMRHALGVAGLSERERLLAIAAIRAATGAPLGLAAELGGWRDLGGDLDDSDIQALFAQFWQGPGTK